MKTKLAVTVTCLLFGCTQLKPILHDDAIRVGRACATQHSIAQCGDANPLTIINHMGNEINR